MEWNEYEEHQIASWARASDAVGQFATKYLGFVGERMEDFAGKDPADKAMAALLRAANITCSQDDQWKIALQQLCETGSDVDLPLRDLLVDCFSYAHDGLLLRRSSDHSETPDDEAAASLLINRSNGWWEKNSFIGACDWAEDIKRALRLANARWELDHDRPIEPEALAEFGGVTERRIRNLMAEKNISTLKKDGRTFVEAGSALRWLEERDDWRPSLWRNPPALPQDSQSPEYLTDDRDEQAFVFVPVAEDGSIFCPKLMRDGVFSIGDRNSSTEQVFSTYAEALGALQRMPRPQWRRPTKANQSWTLVNADRWIRMTTNTLEQTDIHPL